MRYISGLIATAVFATLGLSSCALLPKFQEGTDGYKVIDSKNPARFAVETNLSDVAKPNFAREYSLRAIGETCAKRGFDYFSFADLIENKMAGYCFKSPTVKALGISMKVPKTVVEKIVVDGLNGKTVSKLKVGDILLQANMRDVPNMTILKDVVADAVEANKTSVTLQVERAGNKMTFEEPIADVTNSVMGPADLQDLRLSVK